MNSAPDPSTVNCGIFIAIAVAIVMYIILNKTAFGYELKACGYNRPPVTGINEKRSIGPWSSPVCWRALAAVLSGGNAAGSRWWTCCGGRLQRHSRFALGMSNPIGIVFSGLFISFITQGATTCSV